MRSSQTRASPEVEGSVTPDRQQPSILVVGMGSIGGQYLAALRDGGFTDIAVLPLTSRQRPDASELEPFRYRGEQRDWDLVIICSPTNLHLDDYARWRPHCGTILLEKPIAANSQDVLKADGLLQDRRACVSAPLRQHAGYRELASWLPRLGQIRDVEITYTSWLPNWRPQRDHRVGYWADPRQGGVLRDLVHEIDYACALFGSPTALEATLTSGMESLEIPVEVAAQLTWWSSAGTKVSVRLDCASHELQRSATVWGTAGSAHWNVLTGEVRILDQHQAVLLDRACPTTSREALLSQARCALEPDCLPTLTTPRQALQALQVIEAAKTSALTGERVGL